MKSVNACPLPLVTLQQFATYLRMDEGIFKDWLQKNEENQVKVYSEHVAWSREDYWRTS